MFPPSSQAPKRCRKITCSILHQNNSFAWWKQLEGAQARAHPSGFSQINAVCCDTCAENSLEQFLTEPLQQCWHRGALWKCSPGLGCSSHPCWREWLFCLLCQYGLACWSACHCPLEEGTCGEETGPRLCSLSRAAPAVPRYWEQGKRGFPPIVFRECLHWLQRLLRRSPFLHFQFKSSFIAFPLGTTSVNSVSAPCKFLLC